MRILVADDEPIGLALVGGLLGDWGHDVVSCGEGLSALEALRADEAPRLAILDWQMPGIDGVEICRRVRAVPTVEPQYLIVLTVRDDKSGVVEALRAGANDFVRKPFDADELRARLDVGVRMVELQGQLAARVRELEDAATHIKQLQRIVPICSYCRKVRDDANYWQQVESYIAAHSDTRFSHGICPECYVKMTGEPYPDDETA